MSTFCAAAIKSPLQLEPFRDCLARHGLQLDRAETVSLQVNVGRLCDLACRHCHLVAGPDRHEIMSASTMDDLAALARRIRFRVIDVTGGAPELVPGISSFLRELAPLASRLIMRTNLMALDRHEAAGLPELCRDLGVVLVASLPSLNEGQVAAQRGTAILPRILASMQRLNELGFGIEGSGLELDLVVNPVGAFLPPDQCQAERRFRSELERRHGIVFNHLYTFANVPLGRYLDWLIASGNHQSYLERLAGSFNAATVEGLMCRTLLSVDWDGTLYDCDFNLAAGIPQGGRKRHVRELMAIPEVGSPIATGDHCYACTAGSGFT